MVAAAAGRQLRLLLWKDYLLRKRKLITLAGIVWATLVMLCLYAVRVNVDNQDFPTCQFPARALPSAGMLTFLQSFICSVNNECSPMDDYEEIPAYEKSKLSRIQHNISPLLNNESVLEAASAVPNALRISATVADALDEPQVVNISRQGLKVKELFRTPDRVKRYIVSEMNMTESSAEAILEAGLSIQGIIQGHINRCNVKSISSVINIEDTEVLGIFVSQLCQLSDKVIQKMATDLLLEINFSKYIKMIGNIYYKLSGDARILTLGDLTAIVLRLTSLDSFLPPAITTVFTGRQVEFTYFNVSILKNIVNHFEPIFGNTQIFKTIRDIADTIATGIGYLEVFFTVAKSDKPVESAASFVLTQVSNVYGSRRGMANVTNAFKDAIDVITTVSSQNTIDVYQILNQISNFIIKLLPESNRHEVFFYSTLLAKLIEGANSVVAINWNIQEIVYDVSLRNPEGVKTLTELPIHLLRKGYEALADTEKIQILTSKLNLRGQIFCDSSKLAQFFTVSVNDANSLKTQLCTDSFKTYVVDLINSFGIYDVRDLINNMASLVIQETFGKDTSEQLYSLEKDFQILKNFTESVISTKSKQKVSLDWNMLFNATDDTEFMKVFSNTQHLDKQILITVHGALAKEVVKQNSILELKISPLLQDLTIIISAINAQINLTPAGLADRMKSLYPIVVQTMLHTLKNEKMTYKTLSTPNEDIICKGVDIASSFLDISNVEDKNNLVSLLCNTSRTIETGLRTDSYVSKAFASVKSSKHTLILEVDWTKLINEIKNLYLKLDNHYPYLFEFYSYGMDEATQAQVKQMLDEAKQFWFSTTNIERNLRISIKMILRFLDLLDSPAFNLSNKAWRRIKLAFSSTTGPLNVIDDFVKLLVAASNNETLTSDLPPTTAKALFTVILNLPYLIIDISDTIANSDTNVTNSEAIASLINNETSWPCSNASISELLPFNSTSKNVIKAIETIICMDKPFQEEWVHFIRLKNLTQFNTARWNTTTAVPHTFLIFSRNFDALVEDIAVIKYILGGLLNNTIPPGERLNIREAWEYADDVFGKTDKNITLRKLFAKIDYILNNVSTAPQKETLNILWDKLKACSNNSYIEGGCRNTWRVVWKYSLAAVSVIVDNFASDLFTYLTEITDPNANFLQIVGFTKETGMYKLYEMLPEFISVLLSSYWDYGFMTQIRRASHTEFWECEAVLEALRPPPGSPINDELISKVKPFVCPTLLHWLSMPRGDNTFLDLVAKPQHTIFTQKVQQINSSYENAYMKVTDLSNFIATLSNKSNLSINKEDTNINSIKNKLMQTVNKILRYRINETDVSYRLFNEINKKQFLSVAYLTRITLIVNKIAMGLENLSLDDIKPGLSEDDAKILVSDLSTINKIFKRRPNEVLALHFDVITYILLNNDNNFKIIDGFNVVCSDSKNNVTSKDILIESQRTKKQFCAKNYQLIYKNIENVVVKDLESAKLSFTNVLKVLQDDHKNETDAFQILHNRKTLLNALRTSVKYAYDLGLPIYLKYLQNNLHNYNVVLSFLCGEDWWSELRLLYNKPHINNFFDDVEKSFAITEDILKRLDRIQLVRLLRDINLNSTKSFCQPNITLSDYVPDATGVLSRMKESICSTENDEVFKEIPALVFASQGYNEELTISKDIDYADLDSIIDKIDKRIDIINDGPMAPQRPAWVTDDKLAQLRNTSLGLLSKEAIKKIAFIVLGNVIDAGTLYLNNSQCNLCSQLTTWVKQINLQLYKKQEYDNLLCHLHAMTLYEIHHSLKNDFHWDMAFRELISSRNYTKFELNKSLNELLQQIKLFVFDGSASDRVSACLAGNLAINLNSTHANPLGYAALFFTLLAEVVTLFRAELPYLREVEGIKEVVFFQELQKQVAPRLDVFATLNKYVIEKESFSKKLSAIIDDHKFIMEIENAEINLRLFNSQDQYEYLENYFKLENPHTFFNCSMYDCKEIIASVQRHINMTLLANDLLTLQYEEFWHLNFISKILYHVENVIRHIGRLLSVLSDHDLEGITNGKMSALIDLLMDIITEDTLNVVVASIHGILAEAQPLLQNTSIDADLRVVTNGLHILQQYKTYLMKQDIRVSVSEVFSQPEQVELSLTSLGINRTNFWSISAPRLRLGYILLTPILGWKRGAHISDFVCQEKAMSRVLVPGGLDVVTLEEVLGAVADQFCDLPDDVAKRVVPALLEGLNFTYCLDKLGSAAISQVYSASGIDNDEGARTVAALPQLAAVLPEVNDPLRRAVDLLVDDPLLAALRNYSSIGSLLASSDVMASAGELVCGKPFAPQVSRVYRSVLQSTDLAALPDQEQLDLLPTDFCRSLYKDIIGVQGGKIVWSFIKPLVMGKLLFTPDSPAVNTIIRQANHTFEHMSRMADLVHSLASALPAAESLVKHRDGLAVLQSLLQLPALRQVLAPDGNLPDFQGGDDMFDQFGDLKEASSLVSKTSSLLRCINLDRFRAAPDEEELTKVAARLASIDELSAGLVFLKSEIDSSSFNVEYKIRMDIDNVPTTARLKNYLWIPGPESSFLEHLRYFRGFVQLQDMLGSALLHLATNRSQGLRTKREAIDDLDFAVYTQQMPYPCYRKDFFQTSLYESQALIVAFFFSLLFSVASVTRFLVADVESGNTMLLCVTGIPIRRSTLSWMLWSLLELTATAVSMTAVLSLGNVLPNTDPTLVFALLQIFCCSVISFCYMISKLSSRAGLAAVGAAVAYLVTFMPVVVLLALEAEISKLCKLLVCLFMSSSLSYAFLHIARWEAMGVGVGWAQLWDLPTENDDVTIGLAAVMILLDALLYFAVGWTIDHYFGVQSVRSHMSYTTSSSDKAGVSVVGVAKHYGSRAALAGVSLELRRGQVTALLGHNGAGKTTLLKILTGTLKPSSGQVLVRSSDSAQHAALCPQRDVLYDALTTREHLVLYARLRAKSDVDVEQEVDNMERVLSLGAWSTRPAGRLSGGTRRRVCVALAFIGPAELVALDEPTAGVDARARSEIWSMIEKLRPERAVLLTTHHLDEASLLSDSLVILHKGRVHTTGTPAEIKRALGRGYRLSVQFSSLAGQAKLAQRLLALAQEAVPDARLDGGTHAAVDLQVPFYDHNGLDNNLLGLCESLEANQQMLGFTDYSLDCDGLEQVLHDICQETDEPSKAIECEPEEPATEWGTNSKSGSSAPLASETGGSRQSRVAQLRALLTARYLHFIRNRASWGALWLLPGLFVLLALAFALVRPPPDNERPLPLRRALYDNTDFVAPTSSGYFDNADTMISQRVLEALIRDREARNWTEKDTPSCQCGETRQICQDSKGTNTTLAQTMLLPDVATLNQWLVNTQQRYLQNRYSGFTSSSSNNRTAFVVWYNNKGHHTLPAAITTLYQAALRVVTHPTANLTVYSHPMKISAEQLSKDTVYQHVADAGISGLVVVAYCLAGAALATYGVGARAAGLQHLQLLSGVPPALCCLAAALWDLLLIVINITITAVLMEAFQYPVFVDRNNLAAICLLILLYGYACGSLMHLAEKAFSEPGVANMLLFCGNALLGLGGLTVLMILDLISESEVTDNARWVLHKIFLLAPPFALGDGLLEIAKNTIQAQVLSRFGMETYKDPLRSDLVVTHYMYLLLVGTCLFLLNLAIEYRCFELLMHRFLSPKMPPRAPEDEQPPAVAAEARRVRAAFTPPLRISTIGRVYAGYIDVEDQKHSGGLGAGSKDVAACLDLGKMYRHSPRPALEGLTLGFPRGQCTALVGENGAGKSTVFGLLTGRLRPTEGQVMLAAGAASRRSLTRGLISYCPQSNALDPLLTVVETLTLHCQLRGIDDQHAVIARTLCTLALEKYAHTRAGALSGGTQRRLCAAVAFLGRAPLVLLDEPTSGMDAASRACVSRGVRAACGGGRAVVLSAHRAADVAPAARAAALRRGRLAALDAPRSFGYTIECRVRTCLDGVSSAADVWARMKSRTPHAQLLVLHRRVLLVLLPAYYTVDGAEVQTLPSAVLTLMAALQAASDIEDFTISQTSIDQIAMLNGKSEDETPLQTEELTTRRLSEHLNIITSL